MLGTLISCEPSFGVAKANVIGYVKPPSVDKNISTFAALIPFPVVPATSQVTVSVDPVSQVTFVFGVLTRNGPAEATVFTVIKSLAVQPDIELLSLTINENSILLDMEGNTSNVGLVLLTMAEIFGIYL